MFDISLKYQIFFAFILVAFVLKYFNSGRTEHGQIYEVLTWIAALLAAILTAIVYIANHY